MIAAQQQQAKVLLPSSFSLNTAIALTIWVSGMHSKIRQHLRRPFCPAWRPSPLPWRGCTGGGWGDQRFGQFDVGGVIGVRAEGDVVFAGIGQHVKFMRAGAADRAGVGRNGTEFQAKARENPAVSVVHVAVFALQIFERGMERVAVLHQELAAAHDAEAGRISSRNLVWIW
jgi:hypothetical protein